MNLLNNKDRLEQLLTLFEAIGPGDGFTDDVSMSLEDGIATLQEILKGFEEGKTVEEVLDKYGPDKGQYMAHSAATLRDLAKLVKSLIDTGIGKQLIKISNE